MQIEKKEEKIEANCYECGQRRICFEYVVCCAGTNFYICEECEKKILEEEGKLA